MSRYSIHYIGSSGSIFNNLSNFGERTVMPENVTASDKNLIWIDLEMTGLDTQNDVIIEIATIVTDSELNILAEGPMLAIHQAMKSWLAWTIGIPSSTVARDSQSA